MKIDEKFSPTIKSSARPEAMKFELAEEIHAKAINGMMLERNPHEPQENIAKKTEREIGFNKNDPYYWLYVATLNNEVVGFCRFFHSQGMPATKKRFPAPEGWYGMGILVHKDWRRQNLARFLTEERIKKLRELKADNLYSIVDANNSTSKKMHEEFGFKKIEEAKGFLHLEFNEKGYLYELKF